MRNTGASNNNLGSLGTASRSQLSVIAVFFFLAFSCGEAWAGDVSINLVYTQYNFSGTVASAGSVHAQYTFATDVLTLSGNTSLISQGTDPTFTGADGIVVNPNNGDLLIGNGGVVAGTGEIFQITPSGSKASPYSIIVDGASSVSDPRAYNLLIVPTNGTKNGFPAGALIVTPKDYGVPYIDIVPISPVLSNGTAYPVTGDDIYLTGIGFGPDGTAYYGSGTESSNAGNFGTIIFTGTQFVTHRLFGQPVNGDGRGGVIYAGTHRLSLDPVTGDIFTVGGNTIGQYDPNANVFHVLPIYGPAGYFQFNQLLLDGQGHLFVTACCGGMGDSQNGEGDLLVLDYSTAPGHLIDASSGIRYAYAFLATNLSSIAANPSSSGPPPPFSATITAPSNGATVSNSVNIIATASDSLPITGVVFTVDGKQIGSEVTAGPNYTISWDTTTATNATHTVTATAIDSANNHASSSINVTVNNGVPLTFNPIRVRAGGPAYTDSQGQLWSADYGYSGNGGVYSTTARIAGTPDQPLYQTERWTWPGMLQYDFTVPSGTYTVLLKFSENYATGAGQRVFNILANGATMASNFDIFAQAGGGFRAVDLQFTVSASSAISVQFLPVVGGPKIDAIAIVLRGSSSPPPLTLACAASAGSVGVPYSSALVVNGGVPPYSFSILSGSLPTGLTLNPSNGAISGIPTAASAFTFTAKVVDSSGNPATNAMTSSCGILIAPPSGFSLRVRAGGSAYTDSQGQLWSADYGYSGNGGVYFTTAPIAGTPDQPLYQNERWTWPGALGYDFTVPSGTYTLTLKFSENYATGAGQRVFNIVVNGQTMISNFDIFAQAGGGFRALDLQFTVSVTSAMSIQFVPVVGGPKVDAISIF